MDQYQELKNLITGLENRIKVLEKWKADRIRKQLSYPLDIESVDILKEFFVWVVSVVEYDAGAGANHFVSYLARQGTKKVQKSSYPGATLPATIDFEINPISLVGYSVDPATDFLTTIIASGNVKFFDGDAVTLATEGTAPAPLDATLGTTYYVRDSDGYTFKLAATLGGAAINITTKGTERQFIIKS